MSSVLTDGNAIRNLLAQYCQLIDAREFDDLAHLFTEKAELTVDDRTYRRRSAVRAFMDLWPVPSVATRQVVVNSVVDCDASSGSARSDQIVVFATRQGGAAKRVARCEDAFVVVDGSWRFTERRQRGDVVRGGRGRVADLMLPSSSGEDSDPRSLRG